MSMAEKNQKDTVLCRMEITWISNISVHEESFIGAQLHLWLLPTTLSCLTGRVGRCDRDLTAPKAKKIYCLPLYWQIYCRLTPVLARALNSGWSIHLNVPEKKRRAVIGNWVSFSGELRAPLHRQVESGIPGPAPALRCPPATGPRNPGAALVLPRWEATCPQNVGSLRFSFEQSHEDSIQLFPISQKKKSYIWKRV